MQDNLKHKIIYNTYISISFLKICKNQNTLNDYVYKLIRYSFTDINIKQCKIITKIMIKMINDYDNDYNILKIIYGWYKNIQKKDIIGFPVSEENYVLLKIETMNKVIKKKNLYKLDNKILFDIGAGDCCITKTFADYNNMLPVAIDIKSNIDWGGSVENKSKLVRHIHYNGKDLEKVYKKYFNKKIIGLIMYNNSLHHFGSFENIINSLKQSYNILKKGGILFIREHNNDSNDIDLNLQHILLSIRYTIDKYPNWNFEQNYKYYEQFIHTYSSHFFSKEFLIKTCEKIGFTLINSKKNQQLPYIDYIDISRTYLYAFIKK